MQDGFSLPEFPGAKPVHLVGVGGAGMSAIAIVLMQMGYRVEGSDIKESSNTRRLRERGAVVGVGHRRDYVGMPSVVVRSAAIADDNVELLEASRKGIPVITRADMLSAIMSTRKGIAVAGTHGKTTTTSLIAQMLVACGENPSFLIGGELNEIGGNASFGSGEHLVAEADESDGSLLKLRPEVAVLTNVDTDHLDYFDDLEHTESVFRRFLSMLPAGGFAVVCGDDPAAERVGRAYQSTGGSLYLYGRGQGNDYRMEGVEITGSRSAFDASLGGEHLGRATVGIPGMHNAYNALAAISLGHRLGLEMPGVLAGLASFRGVRRRFETAGSCAGVNVVDDYAHHPTEIRAVLELARTVACGRVVAVFQPHRYSRTVRLVSSFGESFENADVAVIADVYGAGEEPEPGVSGELVADGIREAFPGKRVLYVPNRSELAEAVVSLLEEGDTVITMGAGDVTQCAGEILELLEDRR